MAKRPGTIKRVFTSFSSSDTKSSTGSDASTRPSSPDTTDFETGLDAKHTRPRAYFPSDMVEDMTGLDSHRDHIDNLDLNWRLTQDRKMIQQRSEEKDDLKVKGMRWLCHVLDV